jgi:8-oxo-dGTP diphosphatase
VNVAEVLAAGGVLWRSGVAGAPEVAVVHRPRYDDWSLPKGKQDGAEPLAATAVREIAEETGHAVVLGPRLPSTRYQVADGDKTVHYWAARCTGGTFTPNDEVDDLRWVGLDAASGLLSYSHDRAVVEHLPGVVTVRATLLLVRHGKAGSKDKWPGDDDLRPLSRAGWRQAAALRTLLPLFGPQRVHSAPRTRCRQTVQALATDLGVAIVDEPLLSEEGYWTDPRAGCRRLEEIACAPGGPAVVCSQGGVIPDLVATLLGPAAAAGRTLRSRKGSVWVLSFAENGGTLRVVAADHYADPAT